VVRPSVAFASLEALLVVLGPQLPVAEAADASPGADEGTRARE